MRQLEQRKRKSRNCIMCTCVGNELRGGRIKKDVGTLNLGGNDRCISFLSLVWIVNGLIGYYVKVAWK